MGKQEFIESLKMTLNGRIAPSLVMDHVNYYENYINTEIQKGKSEIEVMSGLGDSRMIARTIIDANKRLNDTDDTQQEQNYQDAGHGAARHRQFSGAKLLRIPGWVWLLLILIIVIVVVRAAFSVMYYLLPILLPVLLVVFLVKLFKDWLR